MSTAAALAAALEGLTTEELRNRDIAIGLCDNIRDHVVSRIQDMPTGWDGHEIRQLLADLFARETTGSLRDARSRRRKEYESEAYNRNLK